LRTIHQQARVVFSFNIETRNPLDEEVHLLFD